MTTLIHIRAGLKDLWPDNLIGFVAPERKYFRF